MGRNVLVTGGATVVFKELLLEVITPEFCETLVAHGFTRLDIQCGTFKDAILEKLDKGCRSNILIAVFDFDDNLKYQMESLCRGKARTKAAGVVIGHAGTGTVADALDVEVPLIIVANPNLMDDHQSAFAAEMAAQHPTIVQGHLGKLAEAIPKIVDVIKDNRLDDLEPVQQGTLPVGNGNGLSFIDEVIDRYVNRKH